METLNINRALTAEAGDAADREGLPTHKSAGGTQPRTSNRGLDWRVWLALIASVVLPVWYIGYGFVQYWSEVSYATSDLDIWLAALLKSVLYLAPVAFVGAGVLWAFNKARQSGIERLPNNMPIAQRAIEAPDWTPFAQQSMAAFYGVQTTWAEQSGLRSLNNLDLSNSPVKAPGSLADTPVPATPIDTTPIAPATWLAWLNRVPHVMLAAETGGGKTTLATHILASRLADVRAMAYIIDPGASGWGGLPSVGGGEDWASVKQAMTNVIALYQFRQKKRAEYLLKTDQELSHDYFAPLTVVMDEAYLAKLELGKGKGNIWDRFVPVLGSGARKVGISVILLTQTANVEDLAISGPLRENYTRIALDSGAARKFLEREEPDKARRVALLQAMQGQAYPAVTEQQGRCVLLDRTGLDQLPNLRGQASRTWQPKPASAPRTQEQDTIEMLRRLKADGYTREQARATGVQFTNSDWSEV